MGASSTLYPQCMAGSWQKAYGKCSHKRSWLDQTNMLLSRATGLVDSVCILSRYLLKAVGKSSPGPETIQKVSETPVRPIF